MISRVKGILLARDLGTVEVETSGGVVYELEVPLTILERLPPVGSPVELRTLQVVREDSTSLYGFMDPRERDLFRRLLNASGVGAKLALAMLSTYSATRLARILAERDLPALTRVSGVGKKKAELIALALADRVRDLALVDEGAPDGFPGLEEAVSALVTLGFQFTEAEAAVRRVMADGGDHTTESLIRKVLAER